MKKLVLFGFFIIFSSALFCQTAISMGSQSSITGCNFIVYDNGGQNSNYGNNRNDLLTIYSDDNNNRSVKIQITYLNIDNSDTLYIYDGATADDSLLLIKLNNANYNSTVFYIYTAAITNSSGAITLKFVSNSLTTAGGFAVQTDCVAPCQRINLAIDSVHSSHIPFLENDGFYYINVCPDDSIHIAVAGDYIDNHFSYEQSDATSHFLWNINSETIDQLGGSFLSYDFIPGNGYNISVSVKDQHNCYSSIPIAFRVRVSKNPIRSISSFPDLCEGQQFTMNYDYNALVGVSIDSIYSVQTSSLLVNELIFLPDGEYCEPYGTYYRSYVNFTNFSPTAVIADANDILYVRLKIEHSAVEDIRISLVCPNGSSCKIVPDYSNDGWGNVPHSFFRLNLGCAYRPDVAGCNASLNPQGEAWNYIWSNNTERGYQYAGGTYGYLYETANVHNIYNSHWDNGTSVSAVDSSNMSNMTQIYHPNQSFSELVGCPLNGRWYIQVEDLWINDNGYIHEWEMALDESYLVQNWSYHVLVDSIYCTGPGADGNIITATGNGTIPYIVTVLDDYNCTYDTTFSIQVISVPEVELGNDLMLCSSNQPTVSLQAGTAFHYQWSDGSTDAALSVSNSGQYAVTVCNELNCCNEDSVVVTFYDMPSIEIEQQPEDFCDHTQAELIAHSDASSFLWNNGQDLSSLMIYEPGTYHVEVTNGPCKNSATHIVQKCNYFLYFPNAITAKPDHLNDVFRLSSTDNVQSVDVSIYNRWGQICFHSTDINFTWNGASDGKIINDVYIYVVTVVNLLGEKEVYKGTLTVLAP